MYRPVYARLFIHPDPDETQPVKSHISTDVIPDVTTDLATDAITDIQRGIIHDVIRDVIDDVIINVAEVPEIKGGQVLILCP